MKKLFLSLVAVMAATVSFAQSSLLATLSHEGTISTYYGASALRDAHAAATNGDIITLSSGSFTAVDITKGITIRGAGMDIDNDPSIIVGDFKINTQGDVTDRLNIEGIYHNHTITIDNTFANSTFLKDRFYKITYGNTSSTIQNLTLIHCKVVDRIVVRNKSSVSFVNCFIANPTSLNLATCYYEFTNSIIRINSFHYNYFGTSSFKNCILASDEGGSPLHESAAAINCIGIGLGDLFSKISNTTNVVKSYADVFVSFTGKYNDDETFELNERGKTFKGTDDAEVGIYGGNLPFDATPSNPQITKCNVAAKSTADGKLSVDITVNGAE